MIELRRLVRVWRLQRLRSLWSEGGVRLAAGFGALLWAALVLDRVLTLRLEVRWTLFVLGAGASAVFLYRYLLRPLRLLRPSRLLRRVAVCYPLLGPYLHSAWELSREGAGPNTSGELVEEHLARTERLLKALPREKAFRWRPSYQAARRLAVVAVAWGLSIPWFTNGQARFGRILAPWRDVRLETLVSVLPGDAKVVWAEPAEIVARWLEPRPGARLILWARSEGASWERVPWDSRKLLDHSYSIDGLTSVFEYRVGFKDMRTRVYRLTPLPFPHLTDISVRVRLPGRGPSVREIELKDGGEIAALRGSWVLLRGRPDQPLESARLMVSYLGAPVTMSRLESGQREAGFPLNENGTLKIDLVSAEGARDPNPVATSLRALEDEPPTVELLSPAFEVEISRREKLPVAYEARDDYGLTSVALLYQVSGGEEKVIPLERFRRHPAHFLGDYVWDLARFPLGSRVEFRIRTTDNGRPDPQTAVSGKGVLHVVDFESAHAATERQWLGAEAALRRLAGKEGDMRGLMGEFGKSTPEECAAGADKAAEADRKLADEWYDTVGNMEAFSQAMREDPYANPGMAETAEALAKALKAMHERDLPAAREAARSSDWKAAERRHGELENRVRRAAEILSSGRELQVMQDFWAEAHRMDQAGSEINDALDRIAKSGEAPSAEDRRKLDEAMENLRKQMDQLQKAIESLPKPEPGSPQDRRRKVYVVPLNAARRTMDALQEALARGDYAAAARIAQQLAEQLARVHQSIAQAAQSFAQSGGDSPSRRLEELLRMWDEVVEGQTRSLGMTDAVEEEKLQALLEAQQKLLRKLAEQQRDVIRDAATLGRSMPLDAMTSMRQVLKEFEAEKVREAPDLLERAAQRLRAEAFRLLPFGGKPAETAGTLQKLADREQDIRDQLKRGAPPPAMSEQQLSQMFAASAVQRQVRKKTEGLDSYLEALSRDFGMAPPDALESVREAQNEQKAAEAALASRDSATARGHQESALELLQRAQKSCSQSLQQQQSISQGSMSPFNMPRGVARPAGRGGRSGQDTGFVPLPNAEDYQPPREIRREVEKSLRERRPKAFDDAVKEYLKRMSQ
ncbi:MAG: DUF4175 family protein [Elusimicrobiota bacterium]